MSLARIRKPTLIVLSLLLALAVLSLAPQPAAPVSGGNAIALKAPSFPAGRQCPGGRGRASRAGRRAHGLPAR